MQRSSLLFRLKLDWLHIIPVYLSLMGKIVMVIMMPIFVIVAGME